MASWWNENYVFRKLLSIDPLTNILPVGHPITILLDDHYIESSSIRSDYADVAIVKENSDETFLVLPSYVFLDDDSQLTVKFQIDQEIDEINQSDYFIYYGNNSLINPGSIPEYDGQDWPVRISPDGVGSSYLRPGKEWQSGISSVVNSVATFSFLGTKIKVTGTKSSDGGIAFVQLDGSIFDTATPVTSIDFFNQTTLPGQAIYEIEGLDPARHSLQFMVSGEKHPTSSGVKVSIDYWEYEMYNLVTLSEEEILDTLFWSTISIG